jgi:YD repeat-containing protein
MVECLCVYDHGRTKTREIRADGSEHLMYTSDIHRILMNEFDGLWYLPKTSGSMDLDQGRTHNPVNEITGITATTGTDCADPVHDRNGNMTTIPKPANLADCLTATYDAWNRLVEVKDGQTVIARYEYDGLNRRIKSHLDSGAPSNPSGIDTYVHYYHNSAWQILETRQSDTESAQPETSQPKQQYVWSQRYIDAAVLRDENTGANGLCDDGRLYYLNDANFNVTALLDTAVVCDQSGMRRRSECNGNSAVRQYRCQGRFFAL